MLQFLLSILSLGIFPSALAPFSTEKIITDKVCTTSDIFSIDLDQDGGHSFVTYKIAPKQYLPENTNIENTVYIYFDFNPPFITNT